MNAEGKSQAVATAADRLDQIILWSRRTFIATAVCAVVLIFTCGYGLFEYIRIKWAIANMGTAVAKSLDESTSKLKADMKAGNIFDGMDKARAKREALKKDRKAIVETAIEGMRESAARNFGTAEAKQAQITADQSGIKDFGEEKWEVTGQYVGPDEKGNKFRAPWTATILFMFDSLRCQTIELGERQALP